VPEILSECVRTARNPHRCNYCSQTIQKGEKYSFAKLKYDGIYECKCHLKCQEIASALWSYIDPDEGMTEEDFQEGCFEFCRAFICPGCECFSEDDCEKDEQYCIDKVYAHLQTHDFRRVKDERGWGHTFKCIPKEAKEEPNGTADK